MALFFLMPEDGVQADAQNPCRMSVSGTILRHINNGLMRNGPGAIVAKVELEGLQVMFTAVALGA